MEIREKIGAELKALRLKNKLSTRDLAEVVGIAHSHIVRIENGKYNVRIETIEQIATALGAGLALVEKQKNE